MPKMCRRVWAVLPKRVVGAVREDERGRRDLRDDQKRRDASKSYCVVPTTC